jgi:1,4-dihydroxy-2-naphthoate octaprenyltransferase
MESHTHITQLHAWILAIRPKTLPAAVAPVAVGTAMAYGDNSFAALPACAALMGSLLLQIGVNLANDYFDFKKGIDDVERLGPVRVTQSGLISPEKVKAGMFITFFLVALTGIYLIMVGGLPIFAVGLASILSALAYSGGPYPLASHGLGDLFVFIFFGLVAVCGTYYVQALTLTPVVVLVSVPTGLLITAILVVNNLRDIQTDRKVGKRTLAVILGVTGSRIEYVLLLANSYLILLSLWLTGPFSPWIFLPLLSLFLAVKTTRMILNESGPVLNEALAGTARLALAFSLLLSLGIVLSA